MTTTDADDPTRAEAAGPGAGLGARLRRVRGDRGLSVRELARRTGCSPSLISQIERGHSAPSAGILYALANQLSVSLDYLFGTSSDPLPAVPAPTEEASEPPATTPDGAAAAPPWGRAQGPDGAGIVQRGSERRVIDLSTGVRWERLTAEHDARVDFLEVIYEPGGRSSDSDQMVRHHGREYLLVLTGAICADIGFETYELCAGDSLAFDPAIPHQYRNISDVEARCISLVVHER